MKKTQFVLQNQSTITKLIKLVLLSALVLSLFGRSSSKKVKINPEDFITVTYTNEYETMASPQVEINLNAVNSDLEDNLDALYKSEYKDQYKLFQSMGYKPRLTDLISYEIDAPKTVKNGDIITINFVTSGDFSTYELDEILSKAKIVMPSSYSVKVEGLKSIEVLDFTNGNDMNKFLVIEGADGNGNVSINNEITLGDFNVTDSKGNTYYIKKEDYHQDYTVVVNNKEIGFFSIMYDEEEKKNDQFRTNYSNGDVVFVYLYEDPRLTNTLLEEYGCTIKKDFGSHTINELGTLIADASQVSGNKVNDLTNYINNVRNKEYETDYFKTEKTYLDTDYYFASLKPGVPMSYGMESPNVIFFIEEYTNSGSSYVIRNPRILENPYIAPDGSIGGELGPYYFAYYDTREELIEHLSEEWELTKLN